MVDPIVFTQLLLFLQEFCSLEVLIPCRCVGLVRVDGELSQQWMLLCSTPHSVVFAVVQCEVSLNLSLSLSPSTFRSLKGCPCFQDPRGTLRDISVSALPFGPEHAEAVGVLRTSVSIFLKQNHQELLGQLRPFSSPAVASEVVFFFCFFQTFSVFQLSFLVAVV